MPVRRIVLKLNTSFLTSITAVLRMRCYPQDVAHDGFEALMEGRDHVVAGSFKNKVQATIAHILPDTTLAEMHKKEAEPGSANK